ncbi:MAG: hypothetical protein AAFO89_10690 [Planctomycetota bacterium]
MFRIRAGAAAAGVWLGAGVAMASADAGLSVRERLLDITETGVGAHGLGLSVSRNLRFDPEFRPDTVPDTMVVAAAPPATAVVTEGAAVAVAEAEAQQPEGPNPNENVVAAEQAGPEAPPKPSILRSIVADWKGELKFGFELASGNNDRTRFRGGFDINKKYWGHTSRLSTSPDGTTTPAGSPTPRGCCSR